jgi:hypothetical protein
MDFEELCFFPAKLLPDRTDSLKTDILNFLREVNEEMVFIILIILKLLKDELTPIVLFNL